MNTTNKVRQVLMNELGLTRDSIRDEMRGIVASTVDRKINEMHASGEMNKLCTDFVSKVFKDRHGRDRRLEEAVFDYFKEKLWEQFGPRISLLPVDPGSVAIWEPLDAPLNAEYPAWNGAPVPQKLIRWRNGGRVELLSCTGGEWRDGNGTPIKGHIWDRITHYADVPKFDGNKGGDDE